MNIVKSLHSSLIHKCFSYQEKHYFTVSVLWGFNLNTGEAVLEQALWQNIGEMLGKNEIFDTGMPKSNAELLVHGSCYAADGEAVNANRVSVSLGQIKKELLVFGDRQWIKGMGVAWGVSEPEPFTEMPVSYANAFGGKDYAPNPLGKGLDEVDGETGPVIPVPNIEYADQLIGSPKDKPQPASLNRIDMMCEQRMSNAGTYDQKYIETRMPGFPDDFNYDYFSDAAKDQRITGYFNGDESYEIRNMHPQQALIKGQIPAVYGRAFVNHQVNDEVEFKEIPTQLDTVWMFPAAELGVMIHRGTLEVSEDDAADIKQILIANENTKDTPRDISHYKNQLALRIDLDEGFKYSLYTAPLIPEGTTCGFKLLQESNDFPLEMLGQENMQNFADAKKKEAEESYDQQMEAMKKQLEETGTDKKQIDELLKKIKDAKDNPAEPTPEMKKIQELMEKVMPGVMADPKNFDLTKLNLKAMDEFKEHMEKMAKDKKDEAKNKLIEQIDELKKTDAGPQSSQQIESLEKVVTAFDLPPILPRVDVDGIMKQLEDQKKEMEKQLVVMQSMGVPDDQLEKYKMALGTDAIEKQTREGLEKANDSYRIGAHYIEEARSPHEGQEDEIRDELIKAYNSGGKTSQGDFAFVDLSDLDLTGIDLSGAYLEYANLTNTNLTDANLSKAILTHAIFNNTILTNTDCTDANMGSIKFDGTTFNNADFTGATLSRSQFCNTRFEKCKMAEKIDMFLESEFDKASFIDSDMRKNTFIDADISACDFSGSDLSESGFINPIMKNAIFNGANLTGVNVIKAQGDGATFDNAIMINVRFVGESSLPDAKFISADVSEANMRDCNLQNVKFTGANMHKADFGGSNLNKADFEGVSAVSAQFNKADLTHANMQKIDMMEGSFYKAVLSGALFNNANLYSVNFLGCTVGKTDFTDAYLEQTIFKDWRP